MAVIKKEKSKKGPGGVAVSATGEFWTGMNEDERVAWYLKQKRGRDMKYKARDLGMVTAEIGHTHFQKRGREAFNNLISFGTFFTMKTSLGENDPAKIAQSWRNMLMNPEVGREECIGNEGVVETCLWLFGGVKQYQDEGDKLDTGIRQAKQIKSRDDLLGAADHHMQVQNAARPAYVLPHAVSLQPDLPDERVMDTKVPVHMLPTIADTVPVPDTSFLSALSSDFVELQEGEKELEEEMARDVDKHKSEVKLIKGAGQPVNSKKVMNDAIVARGSVDRAITTIETKLQEAIGLHADFVLVVATMQGESYEGMKVELDLMAGEATSEYRSIVEQLNAVQSSISKDLHLTDDLIKHAKQETQRLSSAFVATESPYKLFRTTLSVHNKTVNQAIKIKRKDSTTLCEVETVGKWKTTLPLCTYIKNLETLANHFGPESETIRAAGGLENARLDGLAKRVCQSQYFKTQINFMTQHQLKDGVRSCCVTLNLRAMIKDVEDTVREIAGDDCLARPKVIEKMKGAGWSAGFKFHLMRYVAHEFVGVTNWCAGECFLPILGEFRLAGVQVGKLAGTLSEQIVAFGKLSGNEVLAVCDFRYASSDGPRGLLIIPEGYIIMMLCSAGIALQWGFGCELREEKACSLDVINQLLTCWPSMSGGDWKDLQKWLTATVDENDD
jgi:hypothetical protein